MPDKTSQIFRPLWLLLGLCAVALGTLGVFLPVLPTTPLMILAAFFFSKSSPRLEAWLLEHRAFGPVIQKWRQNGAIAPNIKIIAVGTMAAVFVVSLILGLKPLVLVLQATGMGVGAWFILSRPDA